MASKLTDGERAGLGVVGAMMYGAGSLMKLVPVVGWVAGTWTCHESKQYLKSAYKGECEEEDENVIGTDKDFWA